MKFSFLHAADLHLGSPFSGLASRHAELAERFATAGRQAFAALVTQAIERRLAFVVIAGDIYDREWRDAAIGLFFNREVARLDRAGIPVVLVKGNHDAASVVRKSISLPSSVFEFSAKTAETRELPQFGVAFHGRSFPDRAVPENLALDYPPPVAGAFNIGVLHTSCTGRPGYATYAPCSVADLKERGYDYWALGHVHDHDVLHRDPWIVYPGNLQGRSVRECGPRGAVIVDVADGRVAAVERLILDQARWAEIAIPLDGVDAEPDALAAVEAKARAVCAEAGERVVALRVRLTGATALDGPFRADRRRLDDEIQAAAHRGGEDIWLEAVRIETTGLSASKGATIATLDLAALIEGLEHDEGVHAEAKRLIALVGSKLPGGLTPTETPLAADLDALLSDASALLLSRAAALGAC